MKNFLLFTIAILFPCFCMAQNLKIEYEYDKSGNRTCRKTVYLSPPKAPAAPPEDPTITNFSKDELECLSEFNSPIDYSSLSLFVENIDQVEIKIYPNPTTEKIFLEIGGWADLQKGVFKLYSLTGQLLQERSVHSVTTEISLNGMSAGTYILKVRINDSTEEWKIIKQ